MKTPTGGKSRKRRTRPKFKYIESGSTEHHQPWPPTEAERKAVIERMKRTQAGVKDNIACLLRLAVRKDRTARCDIFDSRIKVIHEDGSVFMVENANVKKQGRYIVVLHEHGTPMVFLKDDLFDWTVTKMRH